ncbi:MAG: AEC family transporter [Lachnospiraceae bacterium]|nr:AEC family transporter [Lachnospiraceae bacterium]
MGTVGIALLHQIIIMFIFMAVGFIMFKTKLISIEGTKTLGNLLLYACSICLIINSYNIESSPEKIKKVLMSFVIAAVALAVSMLVSALVFGKKYPVENFGTAFSNAGFIGIPLVSSALGKEAVIYCTAFVTLLNILQWTYGVAVITGDRKAMAPKKIITSPIVIAFIVGLLIFIFNIKLPDDLSKGISSIGAMTSPIAMIMLGAYLAQTDVISVFKGGRNYLVAFVRLAVIPLITVGIMFLIPAEYNEVKLATLVSAVAPVGANVAVFAQKLDKDYKLAVREVCLSTILCIISIPLIVSLATSIF